MTFFIRFLVLPIIILVTLAAGAYFLLSSSVKVETARIEINGAVFLAEIAEDSETRRIGLSNRDKIPDLGGMLFLFEGEAHHAFWMKNMRFPVDIFWIKGNEIVDIAESVKPPPSGATDSELPVYRPRSTAEKALEINAGLAQKYNIKIGDKVGISFSGGREGGDKVLPPDEIKYFPPPLGSEFFISTLRAKQNTGSDFTIEKLLDDAGAYKKFAVSYQSGELKVSGTMNIPSGREPKGGFPVLILNHGLIPAEIYFSGRGSKREQDFFAKNGYVVIHPDYRGLASSSPNPAEHHDFYVGYTEDTIALIDALKELDSDLLDAERIGMWGHSMGGGIASRVAVLRSEVKAFVLFAPISADVEDNFYELKPEEVSWLRNTYGGAGSGIYGKISPLDYFQDISAPIQLHHGIEDKDVPVGFSEKMYKRLSELKKPVEFYRYPGEPHEFIEAWPLAAERALQFFGRYVKDAR